MSANLGLMGVFHSLSFNKISYISSEIWGSKGKNKIKQSFAKLL